MMLVCYVLVSFCCGWEVGGSDVCGSDVCVVVEERVCVSVLLESRVHCFRLVCECMSVYVCRKESV